MNTLDLDGSPRARSAHIGDTAIQYLDWGGEGPPLVLLHATGFLPWLWHPIARALAADYHVIAPYLCAHRQADPEAGGLSWRVLAGDMAGLLEGLGIERPFLVGHSMGGAIPAIMGGGLGVPFSGLILIEPILLPEAFYGISIQVSDHPLAGKSIKRRNFWEDADAVRDYAAAKPFFRSWDPEMLELYIRHAIVPRDGGGFELACHPRQEAALFMGSMDVNPWPLMPAIDCPVMVVEGETSENRAYIDLKMAAAVFPRGEYTLVEGAGHLVPMEQPERVLSIARDFFGRPETRHGSALPG